GTPAGGQLGSYDLTTAFAQINSNSPNFLSVIVQTFATDQGNLTFNNISFLTFEADIPGSALPLPAALPLVAGGIGLIGVLASRGKLRQAAQLSFRSGDCRFCPSAGFAFCSTGCGRNLVAAPLPQERGLRPPLQVHAESLWRSTRRAGL